MSMAEERRGEPAAEPQSPSEPTPLDEAVARAIAGDGRAFDDIYRALAGSVHSYLSVQVRRREDAEDLTGQVFLEAMRGVRTFRGDGSAFKGWLFRIAHNRAVDLSRRLARRPESNLDEAADIAEPVGTEDRAIAGVAHDRVWRAVRALPEQQRRVVTLRLGAGLSSREIAEVLGKRIGTVKALQHRALATLSRTLKDLEGATDDAPPAL
jgi:RNA polymerase sigma-70 factor (ECF subfamily)